MRTLRALLLLAVLLGLAPGLASAAIVCTIGGTISNTNNTATYSFPSFSPDTNATLVVIALVRATVAAGAMATISGTSVTWTQKTTGTMNGGADTIYVYWANTPSSTVPSVYQVQVTGDNGAGIVAAIWSCAGSDIVRADPIRQANINSGASTNPVTGTLTALDTNNGYVAAWMGTLTGCPVSTEPGGWTEDLDDCWTVPTSNGSAAHRSTGETGTAIQFTAATSTWGLGFAEVYAAAAAGGHDFFEKRRIR